MKESLYKEQPIEDKWRLVWGVATELAGGKGSSDSFPDPSMFTMNLILAVDADVSVSSSGNKLQ